MNSESVKHLQKNLTVLLFAILSLVLTIPLTLSGRPLTVEEAKTAARNFTEARFPATGSAEVQVQVSALDKEGIPVGYLSRLSAGGYVLLRTDDELPPVKIHSATDDLHFNFGWGGRNDTWYNIDSIVTSEGLQQHIGGRHADKHR